MDLSSFLRRARRGNLMKDQRLRQAGKVALYTFGITVTWMIHDLVAEAVFHLDGFKFGWFMSFWLQLMTTVGAAGEIGGAKLLSKLRGRVKELAGPASLEDGEEGHLEAGAAAGGGRSPSGVMQGADASDALVPASTPLGWFFALATCITLSNGFSSAALAHVNMPVKVLFKSSKLVPVIFVRMLLGNAPSSWKDYAYAMVICVGLATFSLADAKQSARFDVTGLVLLGCAVFADSVTPNVQEKLLRGMGQEKKAVIFHSNWMSAALTFWIIVQTGELEAGLRFCREVPRTWWLLMLQSVAGYLGILVYLGTVREFGSKVTTIITGTRKMLTIILSVLIFASKRGDKWTLQHGLGILCVMGGVMFNSLLK